MHLLAVVMSLMNEQSVKVGSACRCPRAGGG